MKTILTAVLAMMTFLSASAYKYKYTFNDTPVAQALLQISNEHPDVSISFIYKELDKYKTSAHISTDDAQYALRQVIGYNPISIIVKDEEYYIEALQHGKYVYTGSVTGSDRKPVAAATVMLLAPKDSSMITYAVADNNGKFTIPCDYRNVIAKVSSIGYHTVYRNCRDLNIGNIIMPVDATVLKQVTVEGREIIMKDDKMIINVSNKVKKYSFDGYAVLSMLSIPGLRVNPIDETISSYGGAPMLCINGREAAKDEIKTLNPKDIKYIDYYQQATPEHPLAEGGVIDFIVRIRDHGGMVMAQANQNLNILSGNDMADWKIYNKKSEFGIQISGDYRHYTPSHGTEEITSMAFSSGDVTKNTMTLPSAIHINGIKGQLSYLRRFSNGTLKIAASLRNKHNSNNKMMHQFFQNSNVDEKEAQDFTHTDNMIPAFRIEYNHKFKNNATIKAKISGDYTRTERDRHYSSMQTYQSETKEDFINLRPSLMVSYPTSKNSTTFLVANYYYDKSTTDYWENGVYIPSKLINGQAHFMGGANFKIIPQKFHATLQLEERIMTVDDGVNSITHGFFTPCLFYHINLPHGNKFNGVIGTGAYTPAMKYYTATEKRVDEYQVIVGNPNQRIDYSVEAQLSFSSVHKWGNIGVHTGYIKYKRPIYANVICDNDRNVYVHTFLNGGNYEKFDINSTVTLNIIPKTLSFETGGAYSYMKGHFNTKQTRSYFMPITELKYINKGLQCLLTFIGKRKILDMSGYRIDQPMKLRLNMGYTINNWSFNLYANNPFMNTPKRSWYEMDGFSSTATNYSPRIDYNMIAMRVSYRFTYGKKHKFENMNTDDTSRSAILDAGTK